jgi:Uri superfamily endonuclease
MERQALTALLASAIMPHMNRPVLWRNEPGSYILLLAALEPIHVTIGRLGHCTFAAGRYAYCGSANGPGGLAGRLHRHLRDEKRTHWHIDYLASSARLIGIAAVYGGSTGLMPYECAWSHALEQAGAHAPVARFGSSDCAAHCPAHLWRLPDALPFAWIEENLTQCPIQLI